MNYLVISLIIVIVAIIGAFMYEDGFYQEGSSYPSGVVMTNTPYCLQTSGLSHTFGVSNQGSGPYGNKTQLSDADCSNQVTVSFCIVNGMNVDCNTVQPIDGSTTYQMMLSNGYAVGTELNQGVTTSDSILANSPLAHQLISMVQFEFDGSSTLSFDQPFKLKIYFQEGLNGQEYKVINSDSSGYLTANDMYDSVQWTIMK